MAVHDLSQAVESVTNDDRYRSAGDDKASAAPQKAGIEVAARRGLGIVSPELRLQMIWFWIAVLWLCGSPALSETKRTAISVSVELIGDDALTQSLSRALEDNISRQDTLRLIGRTNGSDFSIQSDSNVDWDTISGKTVIIYNVKLIKNNKLFGKKIGICFAHDPGKCANIIVGQFARIMAVQR